MGLLRGSVEDTRRTIGGSYGAHMRMASGVIGENSDGPRRTPMRAVGGYWEDPRRIL